VSGDRSTGRRAVPNTAKLSGSPTIQANQHGEANRRTPVTYTVPVLNHDKTELHAQFLALDLI